MAFHLRLGQRAERSARDYLIRKGLRLIEGNYRCRFGEIDLIMVDGEYLVFVEVRYRSSDRFGGALASIDARKQYRLRASAEHYRQGNRTLADRPCRFDVVSIDHQQGVARAHWIKDAF